MISERIKNERPITFWGTHGLYHSCPYPVKKIIGNQSFRNCTVGQIQGMNRLVLKTIENPRGEDRDCSHYFI